MVQTNPCTKLILAEIPDNYKDMHTNYFAKSCSLCFTYSQYKYSYLYICLICGKTMCHYCKPFENNITLHATEFHAGITIYL